MSTENSVECLICHSSFQSLGKHLTVAHGINKDEYKELYPDAVLMTQRRIDGCKTGYMAANPSEHARLKAERIRKQKTEEYYSSPKTCPNCEEVIPYDKTENKFCSRKCAGTGKIKTPESIAKQVANMKITLEKKHGPTIPGASKNAARKRKKNNCLICDEVVLGNKYCSDQCRSAGRIIAGKRTMENAMKNGHNPQKNRGRQKRSYLEESFDTWLKTEYPEVIYETEYTVKIYDEGTYVTSYFIDFYFPSINLGIELDGSQHKHTTEYDIHRDSLIKHYRDIDILRISHKEYRSKEKQSVVEEYMKKAT